MFRIIWPEHKFVSEDTIRIWYSDAVANGETEESDLTDVHLMAQELHNVGAITLGRD